MVTHPRWVKGLISGEFYKVLRVLHRTTHDEYEVQCSDGCIVAFHTEFVALEPFDYNPKDPT